LNVEVEIYNYQDNIKSGEMEMKMKWLATPVIAIVLIPFASAVPQEQGVTCGIIAKFEFHAWAELDPGFKPSVSGGPRNLTVEKVIPVNWSMGEKLNCTWRGDIVVRWIVRVHLACLAPFVIGLLKAELYNESGEREDSCFALTFTPAISTGVEKVVEMYLFSGSDFPIEKNTTVIKKTKFCAFLFPSAPPFKTPTLERAVIARFV